MEDMKTYLGSTATLLYAGSVGVVISLLVVLLLGNMNTWDFDIAVTLAVTAIVMQVLSFVMDFYLMKNGKEENE